MWQILFIGAKPIYSFFVAQHLDSANVKFASERNLEAFRTNLTDFLLNFVNVINYELCLVTYKDQRSFQDISSLPFGSGVFI